jgi:hypothetical protein
MPCIEGMDNVNRVIEEGAGYKRDGGYEEGDINEVNVGGGWSKDVEYGEEGLEVEGGADTYAGDV